jgi:hypothetical protein
MTVPRVRLLADDLTGALDTAAEFVVVAGAVPVYWSGAIPEDLPATAAIDSGPDQVTISTSDTQRFLIEPQNGSPDLPSIGGPRPHARHRALAPI